MGQTFATGLDQLSATVATQQPKLSQYIWTNAWEHPQPILVAWILEDLLITCPHTEILKFGSLVKNLINVLHTNC
jgi:hypothetical protein